MQTHHFLQKVTDMKALIALISITCAMGYSGLCHSLGQLSKSIAGAVMNIKAVQ